MFKSVVVSVSVVLFALAAGLSNAADMEAMGDMKMESSAMSAQVHKGHGVVNKINAKAGKINITHDPIESMDWPKMTMDFSVQNKADLESIKPGAAVNFELTPHGKGYRISHIEQAK